MIPPHCVRFGSRSYRHFLTAAFRSSEKSTTVATNAIRLAHIAISNISAPVIDVGGFNRARYAFLSRMHQHHSGQTASGGQD